MSVPIDNIIFSIGAFGALPGLQDHFLMLPWGVVRQIFVFNLLVKFAVTLVSMPLIYASPDRDWSGDRRSVIGERKRPFPQMLPGNGRLVFINRFIRFFRL